ncbi:MAG: helix-turn-helix transcriptional regulator [Clostridia bacterium]|nr:helix-turn-helix transcriptional regulator [Clostridia bacterium]
MENQISVIMGNHIYFDKIKPDSFVLHEHDVYELMYFVKVNGLYFVEGKAYRLKKHDILLIPPSSQHRLIFDTPSEYERYNVLFDPALMPENIRKLLPSIHTIVNAESEPIIEALLSAYDLYTDSFDKQTALEGIDAIVKALLFNMYIKSKGNGQKQTSRMNPLVTRATAYIQKNLTDINCIDDVCSELFVTKSHLHHIFKKYLMTTPGKYITSKRLFEAQRMIRAGGAPTEIYAECGFEDYATFYRNYKSFFGHTPSKEKDIEIVREEYL